MEGKWEAALVIRLIPTLIPTTTTTTTSHLLPLPTHLCDTPQISRVPKHLSQRDISTDHYTTPIFCHVIAEDNGHTTIELANDITLGAKEMEEGMEGERGD